MYGPDVLDLTVAEMDLPIAGPTRSRVTRCVLVDAAGRIAKAVSAARLP